MWFRRSHSWHQWAVGGVPFSLIKIALMTMMNVAMQSPSQLSEEIIADDHFVRSVEARMRVAIMRVAIMRVAIMRDVNLSSDMSRRSSPFGSAGDVQVDNRAFNLYWYNAETRRRCIRFFVRFCGQNQSRFDWWPWIIAVHGGMLDTEHFDTHSTLLFKYDHRSMPKGASYPRAIGIDYDQLALRCYVCFTEESYPVLCFVKEHGSFLLTCVLSHFVFAHWNCSFCSLRSAPAWRVAFRRFIDHSKSENLFVVDISDGIAALG